jgi:hypothetical protein
MTVPESRHTVALLEFATDALAQHLAANPSALVELPWGALVGVESVQVRAVFHNGGKQGLRTAVTNRIRYHLGVPPGQG